MKPQTDDRSQNRREDNERIKPQKNHAFYFFFSAFLLPFLLALVLLTAIDYIDVSDGIEREREAGINHTITSEQILFDSAKKSLLFAFPAGGLSLLIAVFWRRTRSLK